MALVLFLTFCTHGLGLVGLPSVFLSTRLLSGEGGRRIWHGAGDRVSQSAPAQGLALLNHSIPVQTDVKQFSDEIKSLKCGKKSLLGVLSSLAHQLLFSSNTKKINKLNSSPASHYLKVSLLVLPHCVNQLQFLEELVFAYVPSLQRRW